MEYPAQLEEWLMCDGLALLIRPIQASDTAALCDLFKSLSTGDRWFRFLHGVSSISWKELEQRTHIDYGSEAAFAAVGRFDQLEALLGVVRLFVDSEGKRAEMAIAVRTAEQGRGIGTLLVDKAVRYARGRGIAELHGMVHASNLRMLSMARRYGVTLLSHPDGIFQVSLDVENVEVATPCLPY